MTTNSFWQPIRPASFGRLRRCEDVLSSVDRHKEIIEKSSRLLEEWNPEYREKAETEKRLAALEAGISDIKGMIKTLSEKQQPDAGF